jgi:phenylalanyl-tRNA synthetase beta chain
MAVLRWRWQVLWGVKRVYIESAHFSPAVIRSQATRHKKRTEASARFEKNLDPNQNTQALLRYIKLLDLYKIPYEKSDVLVSVGPLAHEATLTIEHSFMCQRLGLSLSPEIVESALVSLGFGVSSCLQDKEILYTVIVPTFRSTKDVQKREDLVEEVGRLYGYEKIPLQLPMRSMQPLSLHRVLTLRGIKRQLAYGLQMREVQNYAFYDEDFLLKIGYQAHGAVELKNPVSERDKKLVTSLIPHLLKNIAVNVPQESAIRFFECNRTWKQQFSQPSLSEHLSTAGIFFSRIASVSFYQGKAELEKLFSSLGLVVQWVKIDQDQLLPLYSQYETAELWVGEEKIGTAGKIDASTLARFTEGDAFIFELATDFLCRYRPEKKSFTPLAKYQDSYLDMSLLVEYSLSVQTITDALAGADSRITEVSLIDFYEKKEWAEKRSVTLRCHIRDEHKTLIKEEIDQVMQKLVSVADELGAIVR